MKSIPQKISKEKLDKVLSTFEEDWQNEKKLQGCYYAQIGDVFVACDNTGGQCYTEDFANEASVIAYLGGCDLENSFLWLPQKGYFLIPDDLNEKINALDEGFQAVFYAAIEQGAAEGSMVSALANLADSVQDWPIAYGIDNDYDLGQFLYENDMLSDENYELVSDAHHRDAALTQAGCKHRKENNGFYCETGYVANLGLREISSVINKLIENKETAAKAVQTKVSANSKEFEK